MKSVQFIYILPQQHSQRKPYKHIADFPYAKIHISDIYVL